MRQQQRDILTLYVLLTIANYITIEYICTTTDGHAETHTHVFTALGPPNHTITINSLASHI